MRTISQPAGVLSPSPWFTSDAGVPGVFLLGSLLFSMADSFQSMVQVLGINFPYELAVILPYVVTIIALAISFGRVWAPAALGKPFQRGTRG